MPDLNDKRVWDVVDYNKTKKGRIYTAFSVLKNCGFDFKGNETVLDIGCGNGWITAEIARQLPDGKVMGIDISQKMLSYAKNKFKLNNLFFLHMDAMSTSFVDEFDLVVSFASLHWVKQQKRVLRSVENSLKKKGQAILMLYMRKGVFWQALDILINDKKWKKYFPYFKDEYYSYTENSYKQIVTGTNFKIKRLQEIIAYEDKIFTKESFIARLKGWLPHIQVLPELLRNQFLSELCDICKDKLYQQNKDSSSRVALSFPRLEIQLQK